MLTEPLSGRRDLVEGLDAEAIFDYLTQHGVLDINTLQALRSTSIITQRNAALLQHVESEGHNAVALFINALRQSGQLHLASSLDNTQRIKPMSEGGYLEKQRHKGEVTIVLKVHALLLVVPERDSEGDVIDAAMLASPHKSSDLYFPRRLHQSYENMLMLEEDPANQSRRIIEYPYATEEEEEDHPKKRSFFCFCFPVRGTKKKKGKEKKYLEQQEMTLRNSGSKAAGRESADMQRERNGARSAKSSTVHSPQPSNNSRCPGNMEPVEVPFTGDSRRNSGSPRKDMSLDQVDQKNGMIDRKQMSAGWQDKENADPVIMEYNKEMELVRLKAQRQRNRNDARSQSSTIVMCEKWKSGGQYFRKKVAALCEQFESDLQMQVIKYIEQARGTLVLSVWTEGYTMFISNICMTREQVRQLQSDYTSGALKQRLDALFRTNQCLHKLDIKDMDLRVVIDEDQFLEALRELA